MILSDFLAKFVKKGITKYKQVCYNESIKRTLRRNGFKVTYMESILIRELKGNFMKRFVKSSLVFLLSIILTVNVWADEPGAVQRPDYVTDYYMIVESPEGGINIYSAADEEKPKLNNELIPNGTALHIEGEVEAQNNRTWGYVEYHGMYGYVPLDDCKPSTMREAIDSELYITGHENVDYNADYDVEAAGEEGSIFLYQGPGEKYGTVSGSGEIPNGEKLHITKDAEMKDGSHWGLTEFGGIEGWVNLDEIQKPSEKQSDVVEMRAKEEAGDASNEKEQSSESEMKAALTPEPTVTAAPTTDPEVTATPTAEPEVTATPTVGATATVSPVEPTQAAESTAEATPTEKEKSQNREEAENSVKEASAKEVKTVGSWVKNPFIWIAVISILIIILLLWYHFKKR